VPAVIDAAAIDAAMNRVAVAPRMPYDSIRIELPEAWNEDPTAPEVCIYYYPGAGGPPTLHVRRDDFEYKPEGDDMMALGTLAVGATAASPDTQLFAAFGTLVEQLKQPDITNVTVEERQGNAQLIRYLRHGEIDGQEAVAFWWILGVMQGEVFTVVSFDCEVLVDQAEQVDTQGMLKRLDLAIRHAEVIPVEAAQAQAGTS